MNNNMFAIINNDHITITRVMLVRSVSGIRAILLSQCSITSSALFIQEAATAETLSGL